MAEQQAPPLTAEEFLEARWREAEGRAKGCTAAWPTTAHKVYDEVYRVELPTHDDQDTDEWDVRIRREEARHVVAVSPAWVLADIAAKRSILTRYVAAVEEASHWETNPETEAVLTALQWPVMDLASAHSDHPDFRREWKLGKHG